MDSDFDWSGIVIPDLTFDNPRPLFRYNYHNWLPWIEIRGKACLIPVEIYSEIFLYMVQADPRSRVKLMLVCRQWNDIMLSTPGIHSQLRITSLTEKKDVERFGRMWLLDVTVDMERWASYRFDPERFFGSFMAAAQAASRWRSLELVAFPPPGKYNDLQIVLPLQHLETFKLAPCCDLGNLLEPFITTIATTTTPRLTVMEVLHPDATTYLVQPTHFQIFSSLTTLRLICRRMQNPVDILPHLHKLETFEAHYLFLPIYSPRFDLPMTQTIHILRLKSVSVQWMADRIFPALEECSIIFPHHADAVQSVYMPSCSILEYESNNLGALEHFRLPTLARLEVKCGQWRAWSGTLQLAALHSIFASQSLTVLHLQIKCHEQLLAHMLGLVPALEELWMGLSSPHALSSTFLLAFAAGGCNATAKIGTSSRTIPPLCSGLKSLHLHYKRWLRGAERKPLMPAFGDIVASHQHLDKTGFSLSLSFDGESKEQVWEVRGLVEKFDIKLENEDEAWIGFSSPRGIIYLSTPSLYDFGYLQHFRELEYIVFHGNRDIHIDCFLPFHSLKELRIPSVGLWPDTPLSTNLPFFHTLKVLHVRYIDYSILAGRTFHKLERYKEDYDAFTIDAGPLIELPVCNRLLVGLTKLASLNLPQILELGLLISGKVPNRDNAGSVWEKHVAVNSNLSGLKCLHFYDPYCEDIEYTDLIQILRSVPALEILIIDNRYIKNRYMDFFEAFVPVRAQEISGLHQSSEEGHRLGVLCPKLESLQIQEIHLTERPELMPVLKDIVTLRTTIGYPLKSFTFYICLYVAEKKSEQKWELIGKDGKFTMGEVIPAQEFDLDI